MFLSLYETAQVWIVIFLVGSIIGLNTGFISIVTDWLGDIKLGYCSKGWWLNEKFCCWQSWDIHDTCPDWISWSESVSGYDFFIINWMMFVFFSITFALVCAYLVQKYAPSAAGSGLPEIKTVLAGFYLDKFLSSWTLLIKSIGLSLAVASGLSVGKEGPAVHMGCCIGNVVSQRFGKYKNNKIKHREIMSASAAAGIAVAFGSPIGGVLFSMEDISYVFPLKTLSRSFFCALIATTVLHMMNPFRTGKLVLFQATYTRQWHFFEILFFIILGAFGGLLGAFLTKLNIRVTKFRKTYLKDYPIHEAVLLALCSSAVFYLNIVTRADMGKLLGYLFQECDQGSWAGICLKENNLHMVVLLFFATVLRFIGTGFAYGCKVPCGIFVPTMAIGATFGRMLGIIVQSIHRSYPNASLFSQCLPDVPCITSATYAFLGAAAGLSGVTRVTVAVVVIMYELTGALTFIVPTMIVVMIAKIVADYISPGGISEQLIVLNGLPYPEHDSAPLGTLVSQLAETNLVVFPSSGVSIEIMNHILDKYPYKSFPIVNNTTEMLLEGLANRSAIEKVLVSTGSSQTLLANISSDFNDTNMERGSVSLAHKRRVSDINNTMNISTSISTAGETSASGGETTISFLQRRASIGSGTVDFSSVVDFTPIIVDVNTSTETVDEIFESLGPRAVLVQDNRGCLVGLLTRKDMLRAKLSQETDIFDVSAAKDIDNASVEYPSAGCSNVIVGVPIYTHTFTYVVEQKVVMEIVSESSSEEDDIIGQEETEESENQEDLNID
ncbi:hypothetical protein BB559_003373 [Furculomyces boomerangus]|uniref:Chloride channel protein n=2 Tax=Harpellales TaxID=61421 RepID=A0A2T9YLP6_9FUNG|nr:hypothetical protein BB559_003373 [Furculomyces boomerangus]PWA00422.1 hypothetical protein BB558_003528 [Smittium angustum]